MIRVTILSAQNLPVPTKKERKTTIYCFSSLFQIYFYGSFKNDEKTRNPTWNTTFDAELYRCGSIHFKLFSSRALSKDIFLGRVDINMKDFLSKSPGNEIFNVPYCNIKYKFPLMSCSSPDAQLFISILYIPKTYSLTRFEEIKNPLIYVWTTFSPALPNSQEMVDIELFQALPIPEKNPTDLYFYDINKEHPWDSIGYSSSTNIYYTSSGFSKLLTIVPPCIPRKYNFFIINVPNGYSGVITVNFIAENSFKLKVIKGKVFNLPTNEIGLFRTVDIHVESNKKYCIQFYMYFKDGYDRKPILETFDIISTEKVESRPESDFVERSQPYIPFQEKILNSFKNRTSELRNVRIKKTFVMPKEGRISLNSLFNLFGLNLNYKVRLYINGASQLNPASDNTNYWITKFIVYDKESRRECSEIAQQFATEANNKSFFKDNKILGLQWNSYVDLDLNKLGINKVAIFALGARCDMRYSNPEGSIVIAHVDGDKETYLFRNEIKIRFYEVHWITFFRLEFVEDSWNIFPMWRSFLNEVKMKSTLSFMFSNNFVMQPKEFEEENDIASMQSFAKYEDY